MKTPPLASVCFTTGAAALFFFALTLHSQDNSATGKDNWEHLAFEVGSSTALGDPDLARRIDRLGSEGWELVDVESRVKMGETDQMVYFFKRPR